MWFFVMHLGAISQEVLKNSICNIQLEKFSLHTLLKLLTDLHWCYSFHTPRYSQIFHSDNYSQTTQMPFQLHFHSTSIGHTTILHRYNNWKQVKSVVENLWNLVRIWWHFAFDPVVWQLNLEFWVECLWDRIKEINSWNEDTILAIHKIISLCVARCPLVQN